MNFEMSATPEIIVILFTQGSSPRVNKICLIYENYTASYKSFPGAPIKFQEISSISRSCRHPVSETATQAFTCTDTNNKNSWPAKNQINYRT